MKRKNLLVTGSSGLIGSEVVSFFTSQGSIVYGTDND
jgi:CDP-paratose 2-epimerase